jgi:glycosyltransferase involved in cell wall biosynthesis
MRILVVSYYYPPTPGIGSLRVGSTVKHLRALGHDVKVLTARTSQASQEAPADRSDSSVLATRWINLTTWLRRTVPRPQDASPKRRALLRIGRRWRRALLEIPDQTLGWYPFAVRGGSALLKSWRADLIFASASPFTGFLVARQLSDHHGIPWVAEFRDLWSDNHYLQHPTWRNRLDRRLERNTVSSAAGIVTVSAPLAEQLAAKYDKPVEVILNGFEPEDFPPICEGDEPNHSDGPLTIAHFGQVYGGRRDPTPLFHALRELGWTPDDVVVRFYGPNLGPIQSIAHQERVGHLVTVSSGIPHSESIRRQKESDVLLLLMWEDPRERGVYTAKLFEYIGARRPILVVGTEDNVACSLVRERGFGLGTVDPTRIASFLRSLLARKRSTGIGDLPEMASHEFTREIQVKKLSAFLETI